MNVRMYEMRTVQQAFSTEGVDINKMAWNRSPSVSPGCMAGHEASSIIIGITAAGDDNLLSGLKRICSRVSRTTR